MPELELALRQQGRIGPLSRTCLPHKHPFTACFPPFSFLMASSRIASVIGWPHFGHAVASIETLFLHAGHSISFAMCSPLCGNL